MKFRLCIFSFLVAIFFSLSLTAQDTPDTEETGLPGDHFSLEGALELFKKAESLEDFEKALNSEKNHVNNLDLNEDGDIDYISVIDNMDGDVHAVVLQVAVSESESQDVAVIELEKTGKEDAMLQIIGDADVYGEEKIVEPFDEKAKSGKGPSADFEMTRLFVNVYFWPCVRYVYAPGYRVYASPYGWRVYPRWWSPWRPLTFHRYHSHVHVYRPHYRVTTTHRVVKAHRVYTPHRKSSTVVRTRTTTRVAARSKNGKVTGAKTTTTKVARGKNGTVAGKKTTTKVTKGKDGAVSGKKTTTKAAKGKNGNVAGKKSTTKVRKSKDGAVSGKKTTTKAAKGKNGNVAGKKTTTKVKKGKNGKVGGKKTTTKVRKGKNGKVGGKKTTTKARKKRGN